MNPNTFPTKGNLILAKNSLALATQGYGLMDKKRNILLRELMGLIDQAKAIHTSDTALIDYTTWSMRIYMAGIFAMGFQIACQQSFMALGQAKVSLLLACLRKIILLIPLIFILPHLLPDPVFGVFLAEPVSDILAATITTITFFSRFNGILERGAAKV